MALVPQPPDLPDHLPAPVVACIRALETTITECVAKIAELEAQLNQNSTNSSKPPSSDAPHVKIARRAWLEQFLQLPHGYPPREKLPM